MTHFNNLMCMLKRGRGIQILINLQRNRIKVKVLNLILVNLLINSLLHHKIRQMNKVQVVRRTSNLLVLIKVLQIGDLQVMIWIPRHVNVSKKLCEWLGTPIKPRVNHHSLNVGVVVNPRPILILM